LTVAVGLLAFQSTAPVSLATSDPVPLRLGDASESSPTGPAWGALKPDRSQPFAAIDAQGQRTGQLMAKALPLGYKTQVFVQGAGDTTSIHWNDVKQGNADTCTIDAALMAMAATPRGRMAIASKVKALDDGSFDVKLWNETINRPADKVRSMPAAVGDPVGAPGQERFEIWPKIFEAAYAKGAHDRGFDLHRNGKTGAPIQLALEAVTGNKPYTQSISAMTDRQYMSVVGRALNQQKVVLTNTIEGAAVSPAQARVAVAHGLVPSHAYAVLGVNPHNNTVWLGDPHGKTVSLPMEVYRQFFIDVAWAQLP
jgi:Calpain family cysteine protease